MHEISSPNSKASARLYFALVGALLGGILLGAFLFPRTLERIVYRDVEKPVPYPVEKVVEKRVPYEVIKYQDRDVVRVVEKPVIKFVEIPLRVDVRYVSENARDASGKNTFVISPEKLAMWRQIKAGMSRKEVVDILGPPTSEPTTYGGQFSGSVIFLWRGDSSKTDSGFVQFAEGGDGRVQRVKIPEY